MPELNIDLDKVPGRPRLPIGDYLAKLVSVTAGKTLTGARIWVWKWEIIIGTHNGTNIKSVTFLAKSSGGLRNHLAAFGKYSFTRINTDEFINRKACLMVGETTTRVGDIISCVVAVLPEAAFKAF